MQQKNFFIFSQSCDLLKTSYSVLNHIHAPQNGGISLIKRFSAICSSACFFFSMIILTPSCHRTFGSPVSPNTSQFTNFGVQSVIPQYSITHRCMRYFHNYFDGTMYYDRTLGQLHLIKTITAGRFQSGEHANNAMPNPLFTQEQSPPTST